MVEAHAVEEKKADEGQVTTLLRVSEGLNVNLSKALKGAKAEPRGSLRKEHTGLPWWRSG